MHKVDAFHAPDVRANFRRDCWGIMVMFSILLAMCEYS